MGRIALTIAATLLIQHALRWLWREMHAPGDLRPYTFVPGHRPLLSGDEAFWRGYREGEAARHAS